MEFTHLVEQESKMGLLPSKLAGPLIKFYQSYREAVLRNGHDLNDYEKYMFQFKDLIIKTLDSPYHFEPFHQRVRKPIDYYQFGLNFIRPLVVFNKSIVKGKNNVKKMIAQLAQGDNVVLLANHQTEPDPQAISLLLEKEFPKFVEEMIFVAGHRVVTDPLAIPFSLGRNLLCIFSKRYVETPPEQKQEKLLHNQRTMKMMSQLLAEGGKCIYVAPSGGRDRRNASGVVEVAKFDPSSVEMFWLMAQQSGRKTHFYPLSLVTFDLLPPPNHIEKEIGERRAPQCTPIHAAFSDELDMETFPGSDTKDKRQRRKNRADHIWGIVNREYEALNHN